MSTPAMKSSQQEASSPAAPGTPAGAAPVTVAVVEDNSIMRACAAGPFTNVVTSAASPFTVPLTNVQTFFRARSIP